MAILTCTDFSETSFNAVRHASRLARQRHSKLTILHAFESSLLERLWEFLTADKSELERQLKNKMRRDYRNQIPSDERPEKIDFKLRHLEAADGILTEIDENDYELAVLGATGDGTLENFALGSTGETVARAADIPVLIVPPKSAPRKIDNILAPVDTSPENQKSLAMAIELAKEQNSKLCIHHAFVLPTAEDVEPLEEAPPQAVERFEETRWNQIKNFIESFDLSGVDHQIIFRLESPYRSIINAVEDYNSDLIVIGTRPQHGVLRLLQGSNTTKLLRKPPVPILIVKE